jgi:hypothetical protein
MLSAKHPIKNLNLANLSSHFCRRFSVATRAATLAPQALAPVLAVAAETQSLATASPGPCLRASLQSAASSPRKYRTPAVDLLLQTFFLPAAPIAEDHSYTSLAIRVYARLYSSAKGRNPQTA